jgi:hypothetical protein
LNYVAHCPSCGAQVQFRSAVSVLAVCEYCRSTLIRHDLALENLGKMATLLEDASPLQLGVEGRYRGGHFAIVGRIQLRYAQGVWNEWFVLFDNQRTGWLSEASGSFVFTFPTPITRPVPAFADIRLGQHVALLNQDFSVTNIETASCIAGEGELPFKVGAGYPAPVVDLANATHFASLDYSDDKPVLFIGEEVELAALALSGLKSEAETAALSVRNFSCPSCGAPLQVHAQGVLSVACGGCGAVVDTGSANYKILARYRAQVSYTPRLALGSKGKFRGAVYEIIGYLRRRVTVDGLPYEWSEYLLYSDKHSFRWLSEERGHWNFISPTTRSPKITPSATKPKASFLGRNYVHFQHNTAVIVYVIGEFYWRIQAEETAQIDDYVAPPLMLSREQTANETSWSIAEYVQPAEIAAAFKPEQPLPEPDGIAPNQPSPHEDNKRRYGKALLAFALALLLIQMGFTVLAQRTSVYRQTLAWDVQGIHSITTEPFELKGHTANLQVRNQTSLNNNWLYLDMALINMDTGQRYVFGRELSYYYGWDDGAWSEGSAGDSVVLSAVPPGRYFMQVDAELDANSPPISDGIELVRDVPNWSNFWLALLGLSIVPLIVWWRGSRFETRRWDDSDYAGTGDGGED